MPKPLNDKEINTNHNIGGTPEPKKEEGQGHKKHDEPHRVTIEEIEHQKRHAEAENKDHELSAKLQSKWAQRVAAEHGEVHSR